MIKKENQVGSKTDKTNVKASYRSPQLATYGDIRELTLTAAKGAADSPDGRGESKTGKG
jgi:hypothetical protein